MPGPARLVIAARRTVEMGLTVSGVGLTIDAFDATDEVVAVTTTRLR